MILSQTMKSSKLWESTVQKSYTKQKEINIFIIIYM